MDDLWLRFTLYTAKWSEVFMNVSNQAARYQLSSMQKKIKDYLFSFSETKFSHVTLLSCSSVSIYKSLNPLSLSPELKCKVADRKGKEVETRNNRAVSRCVVLTAQTCISLITIINRSSKNALHKYCIQWNLRGCGCSLFINYICSPASPCPGVWNIKIKITGN